MDYDWEDIGLIGALAEEVSEEEKERLRLERETEPQDPPDNTDMEYLIP